jgi:hypothetical protein
LPINTTFYCNDANLSNSHYGAHIGFYEGLSYGLHHIDKNIKTYMIGYRCINKGRYVDVSMSIEHWVDDYVDLVYNKLEELSPDFVIFQNPTILEVSRLSKINYVCKIGGYKYHSVLSLKRIRHANFVFNSNFGKNFYRNSV